MLVVVVEFHIRAEHVAAFHEAICANAHQSVDTEPGCHQFDVCRDPADPALFYLYELYDDEAAFQAHLVTPHFLQMNAATTNWVAHKTIRKLHRVPI